MAPMENMKKSSKKDAASITTPNYYCTASLIFSDSFAKSGIRVVAGEIILSPTHGVHHCGLWWSRDSATFFGDFSHQNQGIGNEFVNDNES
jgi:hypothetical protein